MRIRRMMIALLAAALLAMPTVTAEDGDFGFDFSDEGYTGTWMDVDGLGIELCLPDGWTPTEPAGGASFAAVKDDGGATLTIRAVAEFADDILEWGWTNLTGWEACEVGFYDALIIESGDALTIYRLNDAGQVLAFAFTRASGDALSRDFAIEIVGSVNESWIDEGLPFDAEAGDLLADMEALEGAGE